MRAPTATELRRGLLAVSVLNDVDVEPATLGVTLPGAPTVWLSNGELRRALAGHDPEAATGRARLAGWLLARRWAADVGPSRLALSLRPVGLPVDHVLHPGLDWVRERVLGSALDLGLGAVGLDPRDRERVVLLPSPAVEAAGLDAEEVWADARALLEQLGARVAERLAHDPRGRLRPYGGCDVVTLLGARSLRAALAERAGGMGAVVVPMRGRGWTDLTSIDPAFGPAAAAATSAEERGFARPLLLTADELTLAAGGGRPEQIALRDPAPDRPWGQDVLYR